MVEITTITLEELGQWDILRRLSNELKNALKAFCVFRAHGGVGALMITHLDDVFGVCSEGCDVSLLGAADEPEVDQPGIRVFHINALSKKKLVTISVGVIAAAALDSSGILYWWGKTNGDQNSVSPPMVAVSSIHDSPYFSQVSCGHSFMAALNYNKKVYVWGRLIRSSFFECEELRVQSPVKFISCGAVHVVMLCEDGQVFTWGSDFDGQRGDSALSEKHVYVVRKLELNGICSSISCGPVSSMFLLESGEVWCCGANTEELGFLGVNVTSKKIKNPMQVNLSNKVLQITTSWMLPTQYAMYAAKLQNNETFVWGNSSLPEPLNIGQNKNSNIIYAFYDKPTPKDMGLIYVEDSIAPDQTCMSESIEVISMLSITSISDKSGLKNTRNEASKEKSGVIIAPHSDLLTFASEFFASYRLSDLTFIFSNTEFPGHRFFLCSRSPHFRTILDIDIPSQANPQMDCKSYNSIAFVALLQYFYQGNYDIENRLMHLLDLHFLSIEFNEDALCEDTADRIFGLLEPDNVRSVIIMARSKPSPRLEETCESYIRYLSTINPNEMAKLFMSLAS